MDNMFFDAFGISAKAEECAPPAGIPFYLISGRSFFSVEIAGVSFLLVGLSDKESVGAVTLEKQITRYIEYSGKPTAFMFSQSDLNRVRRNKLVERQIPFVCFPDQMYLPFLGIVLTDRFMGQKKVSDLLAPSAQALYLYLLYRGRREPLIKTKVSVELNMTKMTVSRASHQLLSLGLITEEICGREHYMEAVSSGKDYFYLARKHLASPVLRTLTVRTTDRLMILPVAGESALSDQSMLGSPRIPVRAAYRNDVLLDDLTQVDENWDVGTDFMHLEIWAYDPKLFSCNGYVDPVSLVLSLDSIKDERVEGELEAYMEGLSW